MFRFWTYKNKNPLPNSFGFQNLEDPEIRFFSIENKIIGIYLLKLFHNPNKLECFVEQKCY